MGNGDIHPWTIGQEQVMNSIASSLRTIANCAEAWEKRQREPIDSLEEIGGWCDTQDCRYSAIVQVNGVKFCRAHVATGMEEALRAAASVRRAFADMEAQVKAEGKE